MFLPIVGVVILVLSVTLIFVGIRKLDSEFGGIREMGTIQGVAGIVVALIMSFGYLSSGANHAENLAITKHGERYIEIYQTRVDSLNATLATISESDFDQALVNHDQPVSKLVEEIAAAESSLASKKNSIQIDQRMIDTRKIGIFGAITWVMPESL